VLSPFVVVAAQISNCLLKAIKTQQHSNAHTPRERHTHTDTHIHEALSQKLRPIKHHKKNRRRNKKTAKESNESKVKSKCQQTY